jgi:hypothetical protein
MPISAASGGGVRSAGPQRIMASTDVGDHVVVKPAVLRK